MTPQARIQTVIDLLDRISKARIPMDATCGDYFRARRYIGSKDRSEIAAMTYDVMRAHARTEWWLKKTGADESSRTRVLTWLILNGRNDIDEIFSGKKYCPDPLSSKEREIVKKLNAKKASLSSPEISEIAACECPERHYDALKEYFGENFQQEMKGLIEGAILDLRINYRLADKEKVMKSLEADRVKTSPAPYCPWSLRCENKAYLSKTKAFSKGWIEIQDEGSQLIAYAVDAKPGMQVLDYCAGAGGKTLALAAAMENKGRIVAMDTEEARLKKGKQRFRRAGVADIIEIRPIKEDKNRKWLRRQKGTFDAVLVDSPCSGTGTWRRNPDMRWKVYGPELSELIQTQAEILDKVAHTVKQGGKLIYATCSILPEENEKQIESFLQRNEQFEVFDINEAWPEDSKPPCKGPYMRLTPLQHNTDGFFAAILRRQSES